MHYRHSYHAGNFADVFKHVLLVALLRALCARDKPWCFLDTHAGAGLYRLGHEPGGAGEWRDGIARLLNREPRGATTGGGSAEPCAVDDPLIREYLDLVRAANPDGHLRNYPGSAWLAARIARAGDRVVTCESVPDVAAALAAAVPQAERHRRDGYEAQSLLPPKERRGLVLVDPPFERADEFEAVSGFLAAAERRFAHGVYAVWYPLKNLHAAGRFARRTARGARCPPLELRIDTGAPRTGRMHGCGMLVVNPPFGFDQRAQAALRPLAGLLARGPRFSYNVQPVVS